MTSIAPKPRAALAWVVVGLLLAGVASPALAQKHHRRAHPQHAPGRQEAPDHARGRQEAAAPSTPAPDKAKKKDDEDANVGAESEVVKRDGEQVKVVSFSGLDISGELKSPQLLYFLNRLRAEFDRPKLPHRSFLPELVDSTRGGEF